MWNWSCARFGLAVAVVASGGLHPPPALAQDKPPPKRAIVRVDPKFDDLVAKDAAVEELAGGFSWSEGPVWVKADSSLLFSDIPKNMVWKWSQAGGLKEYLKPSGYTAGGSFTGREPGSNGLALDKDGNLILCQHGDRRIARLKKGGGFETLADRYMGKRLNSPNDLVIHTNGDIYFTDPPYGLPGNVGDPKKELDFQGVFRLKPGGELTLLTKEMSRPNGIGLSPDQKTLYVANSDNPAAPVLKAFPVKDDGTLGEGKVFFDATAWVKAKKPGALDGLKVDQQGNVWATAPGGVAVFDPSGRHLGTIETNDRTANCAFGDDGTTLYVTANDRLIRVKTKVKGMGF